MLYTLQLFSEWNSLPRSATHTDNDHFRNVWSLFCRRGFTHWIQSKWMYI